MASSAIHLAVAKKYYERNNISDYDNFIAGIKIKLIILIVIEELIMLVIYKVKLIYIHF